MMYAYAYCPDDTTSKSTNALPLGARHHPGGRMPLSSRGMLEAALELSRSFTAAGSAAGAGAVLLHFADLTGEPVFSESIRADVRRLDDLGRLEPNWDSYGADPISPEAIDIAGTLLFSTATYYEPYLGSRVRPYVIVPLADGGVQIEWRGPGGMLEVAIEPDETLSYLHVRGPEGDQVTEERDDVSMKAIQRLIFNVISG